MKFSEARARYERLWSKIEKVERMTVGNGCSIPEMETSHTILTELWQKRDLLEKEFPALRSLFVKQDTHQSAPPPPPPPKPRKSDLEKRGYIILVEWPDYRVVFGASSTPWSRVGHLVNTYWNVQEAPTSFRTWKLRNLQEAKHLNLTLRKQFKDYSNAAMHSLWTLDADLLEMLIAKLTYIEQLAKT